MSATVDTRQILQAHQLYCQLTGQNLRLDFLRERQWYDLLHQGFTVEQVRRVIVYLQREIREGRRNVGALKLSNLLQPDRFEEDLHIRHVRLEPPPRASSLFITSLLRYFVNLLFRYFVNRSLIR